MKTLIQLTQGLTEFGLFVRLTDDGAVHVHLPTSATDFPSTNAAREWLNTHVSAPERYTVIGGKKLDRLLEEFQKYMDAGMPGSNIPLISSEHNVMFDHNKHTMKDVLDWLWWFNTGGHSGEITQKVFNSWNSAKYKFMPCIFWDFSRYFDDNDNSAYGMEIAIPPNHTFESFKDELNMLLDNYELTHVMEYKKYKGIGINLFTDDCGESGIPYLVMIDREKDLWTVVKIVYYTVQEVISPRSLEECFGKIIQYGLTYGKEY